VLYAAQSNTQIDAEIAEKGRFLMETNWKVVKGDTHANVRLDRAL